MEIPELDCTLQEYIGAFLGAPAAGDRDELERRDSLMRYFHSIINSNVAPTVARNEELLVGEMQKRIVSSGRNVRAALHVSRLCGMLKQQDPDYNWWPVLYFLSECCAKTPTSAIAAPPSSYIAEQQPRSLGASGTTRTAPLLQQEAHQHQYYHHNQQRQQVARYGHDSGLLRPNTAGSASRGVPSSSTFATGAQYRHRPEPDTPASGQSLQDDPSGVFLHRELPTYDDVPEGELLQDLIYVMQGIDGTYVRWNRLTSSYAIRPDVNLSRPTRAMVALLSELGVLARDIQDYIDAVDQKGRLFVQGFCTELKAEMTKYYKLVSETESKLFKAPRTLRPGESPLGATLRRMYGWTTEARQRLRLMATAISKVQEGRGGGDVLSIISTLVNDGDPFIQTFARRLLKTASAPFNSILVSWVTDGELVDPYGEFFIKEREERRDMLWGERYIVAPDMIPVHINGDMTRKIFQIGRSLNFLRVACDDAQWVAEGGPRTQLADDISEPGSLETFVCSSSLMVNERLMSVLKSRFDLMGHVEAIRRYLLFEKGDFALALMEVLDNQEDHAGKGIMAHDLSAVLSNAVRASNVQHENTERLTALGLVFADESTQSRGWNEVALSYNLSAPLSYVVPRQTMRKYNEISRFLLKLKRAEHALHSIWHQQMTGSRSQRRSEDLQKRRGGGAVAPGSGDARGSQAAVRGATREGTTACSEMIQFFQQVQRYISLNVIEGAWARFLKATDGNAGELGIDRWNAAHSKYVNSIHDVVCGAGDSARGFQHSLAGILDTASQFTTVVKELYSERALVARRAGSADGAAATTASDGRPSLADRLQRIRSGGGLLGSLPASAPADPVAEHAGRVHATVARFREQVKDTLRVMSRATAGELPFLVVTIDFNEAYTGGG
ncbi:hypothetical protein LPJ61_001870 [Coemansia biformis]|uniref:Spindle pole body component n=1 Tax=Coemansia biformis TaxID=1286918 RepID=A0A9W7YFL5_9FUNG|nr:hypothetical protein LPJ61_001870 [Coemansia biformis]